MPTYAIWCDTCDSLTEQWASIHNGPPSTGDCGHPVVNVLTAAPLVNVKPGVVAVNRREDRWQRDMPAYARLRKEGHQPPQIDGCRTLEQRADDEWYIRSGGQFSVPDGRSREINEMLADGVVNEAGWSPAEQVRRERASR